MFTPLRQPGSVTLRGLIPSASFVGCADITVSSVCSHSNECTPGSLFVTLPGYRTHGRHFIPQALQRGAAAILTDYPLADVSLPQCIVPDVSKAYGQLCHAIYGHPSRKMGIAGVTGTNGKTTTTWILRSLLQSASRPAGLIGTVENSNGVHSEPSVLTTPDAKTLAQHLASMRDHNVNYAAIELSSHALDQSRPAGLGLDLAIVTNLTHDHLDYHKTFEHYLATKAKIVDYLKPGGILVLNADDPHWEKFLPSFDRKIPVLTFGTSDDADISVEIEKQSPRGTLFSVHYGAERFECETSLIGKHNVMNCLGAICASIHFGLTPREIVRGLSTCRPAPGRMEAVQCGQPFQVFVDFAHTDDAIRHAVQTVRSVTNGRIILVCGAGGDRDRSKRAPMGRAAATADCVILTSDNPRSESPAAIVDDLVEGFRDTKLKPLIELDRQQAILRAVELAQPGDSILVAGKGHEKHQIIGDQRFPFDDAAICHQAIRRSWMNVGREDLPAKAAG